MLFEKFNWVKCISLAERPERRRFINAQIQKLAYEDSYDLEYHYAVIHPFAKELIDGFNIVSKARSNYAHGRFTLPNELNCLREHYTVIKTALLFNYDNLLIFEDDVRFNRDVKFTEDFMNAIPDDFDIIQGDAFTTDSAVLKYLDHSKREWVKHPDVCLWNAAFIGLSRKGMQYYVDFVDNFYGAADWAYYLAPKNPDLNVYMPTQPVVMQVDKKVLSSSIRDSNRESVEENLFISKTNSSDYFTYEEFN